MVVAFSSTPTSPHHDCRVWRFHVLRHRLMDIVAELFVDDGSPGCRLSRIIAGHSGPLECTPSVPPFSKSFTRNLGPRLGRQFSYFTVGRIRLGDGRLWPRYFRRKGGEPSSLICGARVLHGFCLRTLQDSQRVSPLPKMRSTLLTLSTFTALLWSGTTRVLVQPTRWRLYFRND